MKYKGYDIEPVAEKALRTKRPVVGTPEFEEFELVTYLVRIADKVVAVGLPDVDAAKAAIDGRCHARARLGLAEVG